ncbi:unnamed protein product [Adineta ricciae]|uniref:G-protein coupled receptors family 1 profile domain-containing protein n=1 Tax=Adineta ricciae TaxID=249248 RepID=A0A814FJD2_ADIRI|nr:unnamed protein product [Adineta ricciae]CAF1054084.1 unnamed protein product [Adineta ricciae]
MTCTILLTIFHTQTIIGDVYGSHFQSKRCIVLGNLLIVASSNIYMASVSKALYRLSRVIHQQCRCFQRTRFYIITPLVQISLSLVLLCPLFFWKAVVYLPREHYCFVSQANFRGILWAIFSIYIIPIVCILAIYIRITMYIYRERKTQTKIIRRRQSRDVVVIQRILITVGLLTLAGAPVVFFLIRSLITGNIHPLTSRVTWLIAGVCLTGLSVTLTFSIPQLKSIVLKNSTPSQTISMSTEMTTNGIQMRLSTNKK